MQGASHTYNLFFPLVLWRSISVRKFLALGLSVVVFFLALYIYQVREYTKASFIISDYEKQIFEVSRDQKTLEVSFSAINSLADVESLLKSMGYQEAERVKYIRMSGSQVAVK